ncbi:hypothetical protein [Microbacterium arborescens]
MDYPPTPKINTPAELLYLRAGSEPPWERINIDGRDVTDQPELWTDYQRERRHAFEERVSRYRADGLL